MSRIFLIASVLLFVHVPSLIAQKIDLRNYVIGRYEPNTNEVRIAGQRAHHYWQKYGGRFGDKVQYLAVEAASVMPGDVIEPLWQNMINAQTGSGFLLPTAWETGKMKCIMIYDIRASDFVPNHGFLVVENPHRENLARFGDYIALYIGTGSFW
jgi:hypothetical protein